MPCRVLLTTESVNYYKVSLSIIKYYSAIKILIITYYYCIIFINDKQYLKLLRKYMVLALLEVVFGSYSANRLTSNRKRMQWSNVSFEKRRQNKIMAIGSRKIAAEHIFLFVFYLIGSFNFHISRIMASP